MLVLPWKASLRARRTILATALCCLALLAPWWAAEAEAAAPPAGPASNKELGEPRLGSPNPKRFVPCFGFLSQARGLTSPALDGQASSP
jgi:hypothetical protein